MVCLCVCLYDSMSTPLLTSLSKKSILFIHVFTVTFISLFCLPCWSFFFYLWKDLMYIQWCDQFTVAHRNQLFCKPTYLVLVVWNRLCWECWQHRNWQTTQNVPFWYFNAFSRVSQLLVSMVCHSFYSRSHSNPCPWTTSLDTWGDRKCLCGICEAVLWRITARVNLSREDIDFFLAIIRSQEPLQLEATMSSGVNGKEGVCHPNCSRERT